ALDRGSRGVYLCVAGSYRRGMRAGLGHRKTRRLIMKTIAAFGIACLLLIGVPAFPSSQEGSKSLRIFWVDVEGGAATLVVTPEGGSLLVDCGWPGKRDAERIATAARAAGLKQIDHYVTSHYHIDHWGCVAELNDLIPIA